MKDHADKSTVDFLLTQDANEQSYREYNITISLLAKIMLKNLAKTDMRILHRILFEATFERLDSFPINQTALAKALHKQQPNVARTIKKLVDAKLLEKLEGGNYRFILTDAE
jgi:DNA-binding MarR family transcriptional regulator